LFFNFIPYNLVLFFCVSNLIIFLFKSIFFKPLLFKKFSFKFIPNYFGWLGILHCYFFRFAFYVVIQPHDPCHRFLRLYWVGFGHFKKIKISSIIIKFVGNLNFFLLFFCEFDFFFNFALQFNIWWYLRFDHQFLISNFDHSLFY